MDTLTIGEVARRADLATSAIRYYESIGLLPAPPRTSGQRRYSADIVDRLIAIHSARELGLTVDEIRQLLHGFSEEVPPPERWRAMAQRKLPEVEALLKRVTALKAQLESGAQCDCEEIDECLIDGCDDAPQPIAPTT